MRTPGVWSVDIEVVPPENLPPEWYDEDTLLGEFLRLVRHYQQDEQQSLHVDELLGTRPLTAELAAMLKLEGRQQRRETLCRVATLGAELLRGHRPTEAGT